VPQVRATCIHRWIFQHRSILVFSFPLPPFPRWPAFPASEYYGGSAPSRPDRSTVDPTHNPCWRPGSWVRTETVPTFTALRSTGEEPHFVPAASPWLRRGHSPWPPGGRIHTRPGVVPTPGPRARPVGCAPLPAQIRQIEAGRWLRDVMARVPLVLLPITLAGPGPSGSSGPSRLCQGCSRPHPAPSGAGCPQLRRPATTGSAVQVSHLHSNNSASWRTKASIKNHCGHSNGYEMRCSTVEPQGSAAPSSRSGGCTSQRADASRLKTSHECRHDRFDTRQPS
jgi:hypothetical protein